MSARMIDAMPMRNTLSKSIGPQIFT